mgnify:CR=1 FL=1
MTDEKVVEITAELVHGPRYSRHIMDIKPKRRKPNHLLIDEAQADAAEFADKADYWMRVSAALTLVIIVGAFYAAIQLI